MAKSKNINTEPIYEVSFNGTQCWRLNGRRHRLDGPALEITTGTKIWYKNGKRHREDGPAIEYTDGEKRWFLNGRHLNVEESINNVYLKRKYPRLIQSMVIYSVHES